MRTRLQTAKTAYSILSTSYISLRQLRAVLKGVRDNQWFTAEELVIDGETKRTTTLKRAGAALVVSAPIPILSESIGTLLLIWGCASEYRRRRALYNKLLSDIEALLDLSRF